MKAKAMSDEERFQLRDCIAGHAVGFPASAVAVVASLPDTPPALSITGAFAIFAVAKSAALLYVVNRAEPAKKHPIGYQNIFTGVVGGAMLGSVMMLGATALDEMGHDLADKISEYFPAESAYTQEHTVSERNDIQAVQTTRPVYTP